MILPQKLIQIGKGKLNVTLTVSDTNGRGINCLLVGGERPHIGGVAVATPRYKSGGKGITCDVWLVSLPGHKDAELAISLVKQLCIAIFEPVCLTVGIHIDNASLGEIQELCNNGKLAVEAYLTGRKMKAE